jgi:hypothetical protein
MRMSHYKMRARGLADLLLPFALIEDGILLQQDGSLLVAWSYRGPGMHSATHAEMHALTARLNSILRLGSGWMLHTDLIRSHAPGYPDWGSFPHLVTRIIDEERRQQFTDEGAHFESEHFLALTYLPPVRIRRTAQRVDVRRPRQGRLWSSGCAICCGRRPATKPDATNWQPGSCARSRPSVIAGSRPWWRSAIPCMPGERNRTMWRFTRNNAITEDFHNKIEVLQRQAYGFRNFQNYRLRVG